MGGVGGVGGVGSVSGVDERGAVIIAGGLAGKVSGPFWPQADNSTAPTHHPPQRAAHQPGRLATLEQDIICGFYRP